jgi:phospholipase/lecithinase/hemolysin
MKLTRARSLVVTLSLSLLSVPTIASAQNQPTHLIVFGDSLSDTGNDFLFTSQSGFPTPIPPPQTYFEGRFSNGPVAFEYLWALMRPGVAPAIPPFLAAPFIPADGARSFAFGGAGSGFENPSPGAFPVPGLLGQIEIFRDALGGNPAPANALYAIWTGPNDYPADPGRPFLEPEVVVGNIVAGIETLYDLGARLIVVVNLPDLGIQPLVFPGSPFSELLSDVSAEHNKRLAKALQQVEAHLKGLTLIRGDVTGVASELQPEFEAVVPLIDVLVPPTGEIPNSFCLFVDPTLCPMVPNFAQDAKFLFWDAGHPTTAAHEALAQQIYEAVKKGLKQHFGPVHVN